MHLTHCTIDAYGPLRDCTFEALDAPVVIVYGPNESGKTALFSFVQSMLYGLYPPAPDRHPYAPHTGAVISGEAGVRLHSGDRLTVQRRLQSSPQGQLTDAEGHTRILNNETLPPVTHVSRSVYETVYALTLGDLVTLHEQNAWAEIQDRLLGAVSVETVRPARAVIAELDDEANALWRPDRRGTPEAQALQADRERLYRDLQKARARDEEMRTLHRTRTERAEQVDALQTEQTQLRIAQHRDDRLRPVYRFLKQIEQNEAEAGDLSPYDHIGDPEQERAALEADLEARADELEQLREQRTAHQNALDARTEADDALVRHAADIAAWPQRMERIETERATLADDREAVRRARAEREQAAECLSEPWQDDFAEPVKALRLSDLRTQIQAHAEAAATLREAKAEAETLQPDRMHSMKPVWALGGSGGLLLLTYILTGSVLALSVTGALLVAAGVWGWHAKERATAHAERLEALNLQGKESAVAARASDVRALLDALPLPEARLDAPTSALAHDLQHLQQTVRDVEQAQARVEQRRTRLADERSAWTDLLSATHSTDITDTHDDWRAQVQALQTRLDEAQSRIQAAQDAEPVLPMVEARIQRFQAMQDTQHAELDALCALIEELGQGDWDDGVAELAARRAAAERAREAHERMRRHHPDWKEMRAEIRALDNPDAMISTTDEERVARSERLDAVAEALQTARTQKDEHDRALRELADQPTMAVIESDLAAIDAELGRVRTERDRLTLLATIIREADRAVRMRHQPDVMQRASTYVSTLTEERYTRIEWREDDDRLVVYKADRTDPQPVSAPISRGTRDQIYLALRMALVDHLDAGHEPLPMCLDEVLVNWDTTRRQAGYRLLRAWKDTRQVFLFTCHRPLVQEAREALDASVITMPSPEA